MSSTPLSIGWIVARIGQGAHITIKQVRVDSGHWMPRELDVNGGRPDHVGKDRTLDETVSCSDYKRVRQSNTLAAAKNR